MKKGVLIQLTEFFGDEQGFNFFQALQMLESIFVNYKDRNPDGLDYFRKVIAEVCEIPVSEHGGQGK